MHTRKGVCHLEQSEESANSSSQILHIVQDDKVFFTVIAESLQMRFGQSCQEGCGTMEAAIYD